MRRVKRRDGVVLRAAEDGLHLSDGAFEDVAARQTMRGELAVRGHTVSSWRATSFRSSATIAPTFVIAPLTSLPNVSRNPLRQ